LGITYSKVIKQFSTATFISVENFLIINKLNCYFDLLGADIYFAAQGDKEDYKQVRPKKRTL
jgi:hypothetical protein